MDRQTRVLVVDDSALMRQLLSALIASDPQFEVVGTAADPYAAWEKMARLRPDVLTLDVEMPRMDGLAFLEKLMRLRPLPVLMVSSLTERGCAVTLRALELGAVDFVTKPKLDVQRGTEAMAEQILEKLRATALARPRRSGAGRPGPTASPAGAPSTAPGLAGWRGTHTLLAIGASTGGTEAIRDVLTALPADAPGTVIVQHMPEHFTRSFAERLNQQCRMHVCEAHSGARVLPGHALIAPGNQHLEIRRSGAEFVAHLHSGEPVNRHRPAVDVLFHSVARHAGRNALGVLLTGMGADGADGLLAMRQAGAHTLAQDEASCVVFGMPKEAIARGAVAEVLPLERIAPALLQRGARRADAPPAAAK